MREYDDISKVLKGKNLPAKNTVLGKPSFTNDGEIKTFPNKQKPRKSTATRPASQGTLKRVLQVGAKGH